MYKNDLNYKDLAQNMQIFILLIIKSRLKGLKSNLKYIFNFSYIKSYIISHLNK